MYFNLSTGICLSCSYLKHGECSNHAEDCKFAAHLFSYNQTLWRDAAIGMKIYRYKYSELIYST